MVIQSSFDALMENEDDWLKEIPNKDVKKFPYPDNLQG